MKSSVKNSTDYNFIRKHRGELGDTSYCSEFFALSDDCILKGFSQAPLAHGFGDPWFFVKLSGNTTDMQREVYFLVTNQQHQQYQGQQNISERKQFDEQTKIRNPV